MISTPPAESKTCSDLQNWLDNYKCFSLDLTKRKIKADIHKMQNLLIDFKDVQKISDERNKTEASNYNIFKLVKYIVDKEVITHSPILADLLNIHGSHGQKESFYNEFINQLQLGELSDNFKIIDKIFFFVTTERWTGDGSIDILIEHNHPDKRFAIAIENKIFAKDQERQLERYATFLERDYGNNFLLLYLTPKERLPSMPFSITAERFIELSDKKLLKLITYQKQIAGVIENTEVKSPKITAMLAQYLEIIKTNFQNEY